MKTRSHATSEHTPSSAASDKKRNTGKRKRKEDSSAAGSGGDRSKRQSVQTRELANQAMPWQGKSPLEKTHQSPADAAIAAEVSPASGVCRNSDDEPFAMTLEKFVGGLCKSRVTRSRCRSQDHLHGLPLSKSAGSALPNTTGKKPSASVKEAIVRGHGMKESLALIQSGEQRQSCRNDLTSIEGDAVQSCSSGFGRNAHTEGDDVQHHEENTLAGQGGLDVQDNPTSHSDEPIHHGEDSLQIVKPPISLQDVQHHEENPPARQEGLYGQDNPTSKYEEPIHHVEECDQIAEPPISPQEMAGGQYQSQEDNHQNEADPTLTQEGAKKRACSRLRKNNNNASFQRLSLDCRLEKSGKSIPEEQFCPELQKTSRKRRLEEKNMAHSCPQTPTPHLGKRGCLPGSIKRAKNQRKETTVSMRTGVLRKPNSGFSRKRLHAAKVRWKKLAQSILNARTPPEIPASASIELADPHALLNDDSRRRDCPNVGEQIICVENRQSYETQPLPKIRRKQFAEHDPSSGATQRPVAWRIQQKVRRQQLRLQKGMKSWLTKANFSQIANEQSSNGLGEAFIMTEDERHAFAQTMVKSCQKNANMRALFLESVRMLTLCGLMQAAASNLLQEGSSEEAQHVLNAWADFKERSATTKELPMNLLSAVNHLHENRRDLLTKLNSTSEATGICTLSQIDEKTWKFQLPGYFVEEENFVLPSVNECLQNDIPGYSVEDQNLKLPNESLHNDAPL